MNIQYLSVKSLSIAPVDQVNNTCIMILSIILFWNLGKGCKPSCRLLFNKWQTNIPRATIQSNNLFILCALYIIDMKWNEVAQLCLTLCNPMDCSLPGSCIHGIFQTRILEWVAISFSIRPPWPTPSPKVCSSSCSLHRWCHPAISSFDGLFSFCPQSFPASGTFPMSCLFATDDQNTEASASASVLPVNIQDWT